MSFMDDYKNALKKKLNQEESEIDSQRVGSKLPVVDEKYMSDYRSHLQKLAEAPRTTTVNTLSKEEEEEDKPWYKSGLFEDGYDFGDVTKTLLGIREDSASLLDLTWKSAERGYYNSLYGEESFKELTGASNSKDTYKKILEGEEYQFAPGNDFGSAVSGAFELLGQQARQFTNPRTMGAVGGAAIGAALLGNAGPQALVPEEVITVPTAMATAFAAGSAVSNLEIEAGHAYNEMLEAGITEGTAKKIAIAVGSVNAGLEMLQVDELLDAYKATKASGATKGVAQKILDELIERGVDVAKETVQEVAQEGVTITGTQAASKIEKGEWAYSADEVGSRLGETAKSSALSFGLMNAPAAVSNTASIVSDQVKVNQANKLTDMEQGVADKLVEKEIASREADGKTVSAQDKKNIQNEVERKLRKGYLSVEQIEEAIGGEAYDNFKAEMNKFTTSEEFQNYRKATESEKKAKDEFDVLVKMKQGEMTGEQIYRRDELKKILDESKLGEMRSNLTSESNRIMGIRNQMRSQMMETVKDSRLAESYRELSRKQQKFQIDVSKYTNENAKKTVQSILDSGLGDNSNQFHETVEWLAKLSEDRNVTFDLTNNEKLSGTEHYKDGYITHGFVNDNGDIMLNMDSDRVLNTTVGHEITHVLEKAGIYTELSKAVRDFAIAKEGVESYNKRMADIKEIYGNNQTKIDSELTADIIGEYLFTDYEFVHNLSTSNRNVFQKIYDEIKYMVKIATAGSKEARELERVKKMFDKAWRENVKGKAETKTDTQEVAKQAEKEFEEASPEAKEVGDADTKYSIRKEAPPTNTEKAYKLMRLVDGELYPLFIGNNEKVSVGTWYNADSPNLSQLKDLPAGTHLVNMETGEAITWDEYAEQYLPKKNGQPVRSKPNKDDIHWANDNGYRFMHIEEKTGASANRMQKQYGDTRAYYNWGVNGSAKSETGEGSASMYALRPGWHFGEVPSMHQIGYGENKDMRLDNQVWVEVDMSADVDYNEEAASNWGGDIPTHIPTDGYYKFATNPTQKKTKSGATDADNTKADWYVAGAFKVNRILSDAEADSIVNDYNQRTGRNVPLDHRRSGGRMFNAETMSVEDVKYSMTKDSDGNNLTEAQQEFFKDSKVVDEEGNLKVMYHGTPNGDFTKFKSGTYFTDNKEYADRYQNPGASSISSGKTASAPKTFAVHLNIKKPFDLNDAEARDIYINEYIKGGNAMGINPYLSDAEYAKITTIDWTEAEDLRDFLEENDYDYDGLILDEGADGGYGDEVVSRGSSWMVFSPEQVKSVDNQSPTSSPDIRFSMSKAVEETKDLMALHNLHSSELLKQLQMGGMPYPSVAITKPDMISHDNYGEISLILHKDAIDPKTSKYNKIYSADAYTPTFPNVDYEASEAVAERITSLVNKHYYNLPDYYQRSVRALRDYSNIDDELNRWGGEQRYVEKYADDYGLKQLYLAEKGETVPTETKRTETHMTDYQKRLYSTVVERIGADVLASFNEKGNFDKLGLARMAWLESHGNDLKAIYAEDWSKDGTMTYEEALEIANEQNRVYWKDEINRALNFIKTGGVTVTESEDIGATNAKIDEKVSGSDFNEWVANLFNGIEGQSGIRNSKDIFTPSGKRRSFNQTHDPLTVDNIVKVMRKENQTGHGAFGGGSILGASAQEYGSIEEVKRNSDRLGMMDTTEHDAVKDQINDTFWDIARRYANGKDIIDAQETIAEAVSKNESKAGIARYLKQYDYVYQYTDDIGDEIIALRDYIRSLPTPYFEAKPRRGVGFDEVAAFVIPRNADIKLKQELLSRGYNIAEYDPDVEGDRKKVVNQFEEYKFSLSPIGGKRNDFGYVPSRDIGYHDEFDDFAPIREDVAKNDTSAASDADAYKQKATADNVGAVGDNIAPTGEEEKTPAQRRREKSKGYTDFWADLIGDTSTWVDMKTGLQYKTKTLRRILRKVVKDGRGNPDIRLADAIYDELETKYDHNEALLKRESVKLKEVFKELNLTHAEDQYAQMLGELRYNPETTLTEDVVSEFLKKHKGINEEKVNKAIEESRKLYDDLIVRVNEVLREQGFKEIPYRQGYFPHFTNPKQNWVQKLFNWKPVDTEIPTSIAGLTEMFKPNRSWQSFNKQRKGDKTDYSLYQGLDTYIHGALDWIYHIEDLQKRRSLENYIRYTHSEEGVKQRIDEILEGNYDADEAQNMINAVLDEANNPLSGLVRELMNRTNTLANKKSSMDRAMEDMLNRKIYSTMTNLNNRITSNMVVGSFSSALTNFIPMVQSWHQVSPVYTVKGMGDFVRSAIKDDGMIAKSDFLTNRLVEEEKLYKTNWDKASDKAAFMMSAVDNITSQTVWRSKYLQNLSEGMSEAQAIRDADQFAKNLMAGRSRGNAPTIFDAKNPLVKMFTAFQLEVANQYGYMFEDVPQDSKNMARLVKGYATAFLGAYAYNALYSSLVGRDAAFDPISIMEDLMKGLLDDEEEEEDVLMDFGKDILEEVPFVGGLMGGGRIPLSSAFPYSGYSNPIESALSDINEGKFSKEWLKPLYYLALPFGGGQIKKTNEGLGMFSDEHPIAGSYTASGNLRFPVEDTIGNRVQAAMFGQYASENARDYFDNNRSALKPKQIAEYMELDIPIRDYWEYRDGLKGLDKMSEYADYINGLDLPIDKKNFLINGLTDRKTPIDMTDYDDYSGYEEFNWASQNPEKYEFFKEVGISYSDYKNADEDTREDYNWAYNYPQYYTLSKAVSDDLLEYREYYRGMTSLKADKDANGKSISGSKKAKVIDYIDSLNIEYGAKLVLLKSQYESIDEYNEEIFEYIRDKNDLTFEEKLSILKTLGYGVSDDGTITWD